MQSPESGALSFLMGSRFSQTDVAVDTNAAENQMAWNLQIVVYTTDVLRETPVAILAMNSLYNR